MNTKAIIYISYHHKNTIKLLEDAFNKDEYDFYNLAKTKEDILLDQYEIIVFASGIYFSKMDKRILRFIEENLDKIVNKKIYCVITAGWNPKHYARKVKRYLKKQGLKDIEVFSCPGYDTYGPLKLIGGVNRKRPNKKDVFKLKEFILENKLWYNIDAKEINYGKKQNWKYDFRRRRNSIYI